MNEIHEIKESLIRIEIGLQGDTKIGVVGVKGRLDKIDDRIVKFEETQENFNARLQKIETKLFKSKFILGFFATVFGTVVGWLSKTWVWKWIAAALSFFK